MQRVATFTKIQGNGNIEVIMNGIVNKEIQRLRRQELFELNKANEELERERDAVKMIKKQRDRLLAEKYAESKPRRMSIRTRVKESIIFAWACLICWSEMLGLIEYIGPKKEREKK
jgi:hypothetical protein